MQRVWVLVACGLLLAACGGGGGNPDGGVLPDGGRIDGGFDGGRGGECSLAAQDCTGGKHCIAVDPGDGGAEPRCLAGACDVVLQDCTGGQKCSYVQSGGTSERACTAAIGSASEGQPCETRDGGLDTCAAGLFCAGTDGGTADVKCRRFCTADNGCATDQVCIPTNIGTGTSERPGICFAAPVCDLLAQDCPVPQGCYPSGTTGRCYDSKGIAVGKPCSFANDCEPGATCAGSDPSNLVCRTLCNRSGGTPSCSSGTCSELGGAPASVGVCL